MQAIRIHKKGGPEVLELEEIDLDPPGPGEVQVRHTSIGVNFIDVYHRTGLYPVGDFPHGIGVEAAGVIEARGPDVTLPIGMRVAYVANSPGSYAELRNVPADRIVRVPDQVGDDAAAALLLKGMTVEYLTRRTFRVEAGMTVLFHAIAGGVGTIACQWLKHLGATVIGTVSSEEKAATARANGCDHVVITATEDLVARVREITKGDGVPVVYDSIGRDTFDASLACLARRGMLVGFGNASGPPGPFDPMALARGGSLFVTRASLFDYTRARPELEASAAALFEVVKKGAVRPSIGQRFMLEDAAECHRALQDRKTTGSTVLLP